MAEEIIKAKKIEVKSKKSTPLYVTLIIDAVMLVIGVCMCIWADKVVDTIVKAIGAVCVVYAVFNLVQYLRTENRSNKDLPLLITAIALAIAGVFLIVQSGLVNSIVTIIIGALITLISIFHLQDALNMKGKSSKYTYALITSVIGLVCGVCCMFGLILAQGIPIILIGIALIIFAASDIFGAISLKLK